MADKLQYKTPPLIEAVATFHFEREGWDWTQPGVFHISHKADYPKVEQNMVVWPVAQPEGFEYPQSIDFSSEDKRSIIRMNAQTLSIHELAPYKGWDDLSARLRAALKTYSEIAPQRVCSAVSLRYINVVKPPDNIENIRMGEDITIWFNLPNSHKDCGLFSWHTSFAIKGHSPDTQLQTTFIYNHPNIHIYNTPFHSNMLLLDLTIAWQLPSAKKINTIQLSSNETAQKYEDMHEELSNYFMSCFSPEVHRDWFGRSK